MKYVTILLLCFGIIFITISSIINIMVFITDDHKLGNLDNIESCKFIISHIGITIEIISFILLIISLILYVKYRSFYESINKIAYINVDDDYINEIFYLVICCLIIYFCLTVFCGFHTINRLRLII